MTKMSEGGENESKQARQNKSKSEQGFKGCKAGEKSWIWVGQSGLRRGWTRHEALSDPFFCEAMP